MDADEAASGPVGENRRARVEAEREWAVDASAAEATQPVTDVELARRSRPALLPDADPRAEGDLPAPDERCLQPATVDLQPRAHAVVAAEGVLGDPAGRA